MKSLMQKIANMMKNSRYISKVRLFEVPSKNCSSTNVRSVYAELNRRKLARKTQTMLGHPRMNPRKFQK